MLDFRLKLSFQYAPLNLRVLSETSDSVYPAAACCCGGVELYSAYTLEWLFSGHAHFAYRNFGVGLGIDGPG